jgi:hypothetical protein
MQLAGNPDNRYPAFAVNPQSMCCRAKFAHLYLVQHSKIARQQVEPMAGLVRPYDLDLPRGQNVKLFAVRVTAQNVVLNVGSHV